MEFYCAQNNVIYCQGMLEVVLPFLIMKQRQEDESEQKITAIIKSPKGRGKKTPISCDLA